VYYEYRDSRRYRLHYDGFPQLLFITTDTDVERRIAAYAREAAAGRVAPLPLLLTAQWRYRGRPGYAPPPDGLLVTRTNLADGGRRRAPALAAAAGRTLVAKAAASRSAPPGPNGAAERTGHRAHDADCRTHAERPGNSDSRPRQPVRGRDLTGC
jgi:hypothetical protein